MSTTSYQIHDKDSNVIFFLIRLQRYCEIFKYCTFLNVKNSFIGYYNWKHLLLGSTLI